MSSESSVADFIPLAIAAIGYILQAVYKGYKKSSKQNHEGTVARQRAQERKKAFQSKRCDKDCETNVSTGDIPFSWVDPACKEKGKGDSLIEPICVAPPIPPIYAEQILSENSDMQGVEESGKVCSTTRREARMQNLYRGVGRRRWFLHQAILERKVY